MLQHRQPNLMEPQMAAPGSRPGPDGEHPPTHRHHRYHKRGNVNKSNHVQEMLPLDEAARREMASLPTKTPVSVLQELLARRGTVPKYELVQIEGMIHEPTFRYRVTVADIMAMGTGRSKKEAKHAAAKALLDKLTGNTQTEATNGGNIEVTPAPLTMEEKMVGNPVGWLQEMCMSRLWPPPAYHSTNDDNVSRRMPHERTFTMVCTLLRRREVGSGKSKKLAKRQAAYKMWQALQDNPPDTNETGTDANAMSRYADLKDSKISTLTTSHSHKVSQFHKHLKQNVGVNVNKLQSTSLNNKEFNFVQFLQEIATEQSFEVTYVDIEEKNLSGHSQCLVQLSTLPVAVCYGSGISSKDAQSAAAQNALEYLKIMTTK